MKRLKIPKAAKIIAIASLAAGIFFGGVHIYDNFYTNNNAYSPPNFIERIIPGINPSKRNAEIEVLINKAYGEFVSSKRIIPNSNRFVVNDEEVFFQTKFVELGYSPSERDPTIFRGQEIAKNFKVFLNSKIRTIDLNSHAMAISFNGFDRDSYIQFEYAIPDLFSSTQNYEVLINNKKVPEFMIKRVEKDGISPLYGNDLRFYLSPRFQIFIDDLIKSGIVKKSELDAVLTLDVHSKINLSPPQRVAKKEVGTMEDYLKMPGYKNLTGEFEVENDKPKSSEKEEGTYEKYSHNIDHPLIIAIRDEILSKNDNPYDIALACLTRTIKFLEYDEGKEKGYSDYQAILTGMGDCDDYANVFVTLCRACGIPAKIPSNGGIVEQVGANGEKLTGSHRWAEFCLPLADGTYRWFMAEPTWADGQKDVFKYFMKIDGVHMYDLDFKLSIHTPRGEDANKGYIFENISWKINQK